MWTTLKLHSKVQGPPNHDPSVSRASQPNRPKKIRNLCFYGGLELLESRWKHHIKASKNSTIITNFRSIWRKHHDLYQKDIVWWRPTYRCKCRHPEIRFQSVANHIYCHAGKTATWPWRISWGTAVKHTIRPAAEQTWLMDAIWKNRDKNITAQRNVCMFAGNWEFVGKKCN